MTNKQLRIVLEAFPDDLQVLMDPGCVIDGHFRIDDVREGWHKPDDTDEMVFNHDPWNFDDGEEKEFTENVIVLQFMG